MFLCRTKPTSPSRRVISWTSNRFFKKGKNKKLMPVSTRSHYEDKKTKRKRLTAPSQKFYYLYRGLHKASPNTAVLNISKVTYSNFQIATVKFGSNAQFNVKAPCGYKILLRKHRRTFLDQNMLVYGTGDSIPLYASPTGGQIFSLKVIGYRSWRIAESAGTFCKVLWHDPDRLHTAMNIPTKLFQRLNFFSDCIVGRVSNRFYNYTKSGKASVGIKKRRQVLSVRGIAMNPVGHPNGGRSNTKRPLRNPWGKAAK